MIDVAKGFSILLVVLGHNWILTSNDSFATLLLDGFRVPVFFFLSGVFFSAKNFREQLKRKTEAYIKPFVVVSMGAFVGFVLLKGFYSFWLFGFAYGTGRSILWPWSPIWFLPHLWLVWLAACGVARCVKWSELRLSLRLVLVMVLMILGGFVVQAFSRNMDWWTGLLPFMGLPFSADLLLVDLSYFLLGSVAKEYLLSGRMYSWAFWFVFPVWGSVQLFAGFPINLNAREYGDLFVTPIKVALGVLMIVTLSAAVIRVNSISSLISKVGESSLFILLFHSPIQHLLHKVLTQLGLNPWGSSCIGFLVAIAVPVWLHGIAKRNKPLGRLFFVS